MMITECRVKLVTDSVASGNDRVRAFCALVFDGLFKLHDVKVVARGDGELLVCMPNRKLQARCGWCGGKNALRQRFCGECGTRLPDGAAKQDEKGRDILYSDVFHPIGREGREAIRTAILEAYQAERVASELPGYVSSWDAFEPASKTIA